MNRAEANDLKAFITRQADVARKAYGRRSQTYPRQCVFVGTTNDDEYLKDATGGRRFWPVRTTVFDIESLVNDRDQLWAEAYMNYQLGEALYLDDVNVRVYADQEQKARFVIDEIASNVQKAADSLMSDDLRSFFTFAELWAEMNLQQNVITVPKPADQIMQNRIKKALRVLGYETTRIRLKGNSENDDNRERVWHKKVRILKK